MDGVDANGEAVDGVSPPVITTTCLLSKSASPKALLIDLSAHPDGFEITNVAIYDKALAEKTGADADWTRRSLYMGPHYDTLDTSVQDAFGSYLAERGVDEALCKFFLPQGGALVTAAPGLANRPPLVAHGHPAAPCNSFQADTQPTSSSSTASTRSRRTTSPGSPASRTSSRRKREANQMQNMNHSETC